MFATITIYEVFGYQIYYLYSIKMLMRITATIIITVLIIIRMMISYNMYVYKNIYICFFFFCYVGSNQKQKSFPLPPDLRQVLLRGNCLQLMRFVWWDLNGLYYRLSLPLLSTDAIYAAPLPQDCLPCPRLQGYRSPCCTSPATPFSPDVRYRVPAVRAC